MEYWTYQHRNKYIMQVPGNNTDSNKQYKSDSMVSCVSCHTKRVPNTFGQFSVFQYFPTFNQRSCCIKPEYIHRSGNNWFHLSWRLYPILVYLGHAQLAYMIMIELHLKFTFISRRVILVWFRKWTKASSKFQKIWKSTSDRRSLASFF